jgi:hypothetical protein
MSIFDCIVFTHPHAFFAAGTGIRIFKTNMVAVRPMQFSKNIFRANIHTFPAPMTLPTQEMNVLRFNQMAKRDQIHEQS